MRESGGGSKFVEDKANEEKASNKTSAGLLAHVQRPIGRGGAIAARSANHRTTTAVKMMWESEAGRALYQHAARRSINNVICTRKVKCSKGKKRHLSRSAATRRTCNGNTRRNARELYTPPIWTGASKMNPANGEQNMPARTKKTRLGPKEKTKGLHA